MAIIKCKMCGGDLQIIEGSSVCECEYCGTKQTVPNADNEKKMTLFSRALRLLRNCEFDKASGVFETIVADFPEEAEAYWGLVLCKYGIEYVDDPGTGKKVPTCHRSSFESVLDDQNFEQACENADAIARRVYRDEARQIEELRKGIIEVSGKEDPYDIFISYKETDENGDRTLDSVIAQDIYNELTEKGYRVFFSRISLESKLGTEYEPYIFAALNSAKVMIVVGTDYENFDAVWVKNEWSRFLKLIASGQKKTLIPVFKNMDAYDMPKEFAKLSAQDMGKVGALQDLLYGVEKLLGKKGPAAPESTGAYADSGMTVMNAQTAAMLKRGYMMLSDGAYTKADELFEKVLNNDAECGQAYWGKALAAANVSDASQFGAVAAFNCLKSDISKIVSSDIIMDLIKVLGCGIEIPIKTPKRGVLSFDINNLKWNKIIICTDADVDGFQIRTLILTMIYRLCPTLIEEGYVYIAETPLYEMRYKTRANEETFFAFDEKEKNKIMKGKDPSRFFIQRSKGLGENTAEFMWLTTMDPKTRRLIRVTSEDAEKMLEYFELYLGNNVAARKSYIEENGHLYTDDLDLD